MRGGYRQNAGRKKGFAAKNAEEARRLLSERVALEIEPLCDILISMAKNGDMRAMKELFDRAWGRSYSEAQTDVFEEKLSIPIMGLQWSDLTEETLNKYAFSDEEKAVLEKRLITKG